MSFSHLYNSVRGAFVTTLAVALVASLSFVMFEPSVSRSAVEEFIVTQTISGAISFMASTSDVAMVGSLDGLTGGTSYGTTTSRVRTNNITGYNMTIQFSSSTAMGRNGDGGFISNYLYSTTTTDYPSGYDTSPANAQFGFSAAATDVNDVSDVFTHSGSLCGSSNNGSFTTNNCWRGASTTIAAATEIINTSGPTPASGSTSTVQFRITIPNSPSPAVPDGTYTATATLTATDN